MQKTKELITIIAIVFLGSLVLGCGKVQANHDISCDYFEDELYYLRDDGYEYKVISEKSAPKIIESEWQEDEGVDKKIDIPEDEIKKLQFSSSDEDIATINSTTGEITIKKTGTFFVKSQGENEFAIEVIEDSKYKEALNSRNIGTNIYAYGEHTSYYGREVWMSMITKAQIYNLENIKENFEDFSISSSDENVVTVNSEGTIKAIGEGNAFIYIDCGDYKDRSLLVHVSGGNPTFITDENDLENINYNNTTGISIEIPDLKKVPSSIFKNLKKIPFSTLDVELDEYSWSFNNSNNFTNTDIDFVPTIKISNTIPNTIENNEITDGVFLNFDHEGKLPSTAQVMINIGIDKFGENEKTLYLYYYNPTTKLYEYISEVNYNAGTLDFYIDHCSEYIITDAKLSIIDNSNNETITTETDENNNKRKLDEDPKTGEKSILLFEIIAVVSLIGIAVGKTIIK